MEVKVQVDSIRTDGRFRRDLGDVQGLAKSIENEGLIHAITVTPTMRLLSGERRLAAVRLLGWESIDARVVDTLDDAAARLRIERDENTQRKAMTPEELVRLGLALEELERPKAAARKQAGVSPGPSDHVVGRSGDTRDIVASAIGMSPMSYNRAKTVVTAADDQSMPAEDRKVAQTALADMNATGNIAGNYDKVRAVRDPRLGRPSKSTLDSANQQRRAIDRAVVSLTGMTYGLNLIGELHADITHEEAARWLDGLSAARRTIEVLIKRLKERTNGQA